VSVSASWNSRFTKQYNLVLVVIQHPRSAAGEVTVGGNSRTGDESPT